MQSSTEGIGRPDEAPPPATPAVFVAEEAPVSDEMTDLGQRLTVLQSKRVEDKARIKELEKFKAHYLQVCMCVLCMCVCVYLLVKVRTAGIVALGHT